MTNKIERGTSLHVRRQIEDALDTLTAGAVSAANPTATASDTAVNGVATTFMRSDAAPAVQKGSSSAFGVVKVDNSTITASGGVISAVAGGGSVAGSDKQIQYNASGAFGAEAGFEYDYTNNVFRSNFATIGAGATWNANPTGADPAHVFEIVTNPTGGDAAAGNFGLRIVAYGAAARSSQHFARARGTQASPTALQSGDALFAIDGRGYNGSAMSESSFLMYPITTENWTTSANGAECIFEITPNGSTPALGRTERFRIRSSGVLITGTAVSTGAVSGSNLSSSGGANPSATASDVAVNGSAITFMRSDAAPAVQKATSGQFGLVKVDGTSITATGGVISAASGAGTVTHTGGALTANRVVLGAGSDDITVLGSLGTTSTLLHGNAAGAPTFGAVVTADITDANVTLAKIANAAANSKLVGSGSAGSGAPYSEITVGTGLSMSGTTISATGTSSPIASGSSNPGSPSTNDIFYRTDLGWLIYYDGTRWLTFTEFAMSATMAATLPVSATGTVAFLGFRTDYNAYLTRTAMSTFPNTTNNGSNYWTIAYLWASAAASLTNLTSFDTSGDTVDNWTRHSQSIAAVMDANCRAIYVRVTTKTGSPISVYLAGASLYYRLIIT